MHFHYFIYIIHTYVLIYIDLLFAWLIRFYFLFSWPHLTAHLFAIYFPFFFVFFLFFFSFLFCLVGLVTIYLFIFYFIVLSCICWQQTHWRQLLCFATRRELPNIIWYISFYIYTYINMVYMYMVYMYIFLYT